MVAQAIRSTVDVIGTVNAAATDTNTIVVAADEYVQVYGITFSMGTTSGTVAASVGDGALVKVTVGSTDVLGLHVPSASNPNVNFTSTAMFPPGTYYQGAAGEDLVVTVQDTFAATNNLQDVVTTVFYWIRKVKKGN